MTIYDKVIEWATAGGGTGDAAEIPANVKDYIDQQFDQMGTFHSDETTVPLDAEPRAQIFFTPYDLVQHWAGSNLLIQDGNGGFLRNEILHIVYNVEIDTGQGYYTVYVGASE